MESRLALLNVGWAVVHSPELVQALRRYGKAEQVGELGPLKLFRINQPLSYVQSGHARVTSRSFNRVEFADAQGDQLVLRYLWVPGMVTVPPAKVEPTIVAPGFPPLVRVVNPPARFVLSTCATCQAGATATRE